MTDKYMAEQTARQIDRHVDEDTDSYMIIQTDKGMDRLTDILYLT